MMQCQADNGLSKRTENRLFLLLLLHLRLDSEGMDSEGTREGTQEGTRRWSFFQR